MRKATTLALVAVVGLALLATDGFARSGGKRGGGRRGGGAGCEGGLASKVGLTPEQQTKVAALRTTLQAAVKPMRESLQGKRTELQALWKAEKPSRSAIMAKHAELAALHAKLVEARVDFRLGLQSLLTPEQRAKLQEMGAKRGERGQRGRHGRRGGRGGRGGQGSEDEGACDDEGASR